MAWYRIQLTEDERRIVNEERTSHPKLHVRAKMLTIWLLHCGVTRQKAAEIVGVSRATVQRYVDAYCKGGLDGLRHSSVPKAVSELAAFRDIIRASFAEAPVCTIAAACDRIEKLTGIRRSPTQVRKFLKGLGLKWQRIRVIPVPPKKNCLLSRICGCVLARAGCQGCVTGPVSPRARSENRMTFLSPVSPCC